MGAKCNHIYYKNMTHCGAYYRYSDKSITFSTIGLAHNKKLVDYLIVHELAHYFQNNHGEKF